MNLKFWKYLAAIAIVFGVFGEILSLAGIYFSSIYFWLLLVCMYLANHIGPPFRHYAPNKKDEPLEPPADKSEPALMDEASILLLGQHEALAYVQERFAGLLTTYLTHYGDPDRLQQAGTFMNLSANLQMTELLEPDEFGKNTKMQVTVNLDIP